MRHDTVAFFVFQFFLLTGAAFRLQRIVTTDTWPPSRWFRMGVDKRFGPESDVAEFFQCPWCFGFWTTLAVFSLATLWLDVPLVLLQALAAAAIVGLVGSRDG